MDRNHFAAHLRRTESSVAKTLEAARSGLEGSNLPPYRALSSATAALRSELRALEELQENLGRLKGKEAIELSAQSLAQELLEMIDGAECHNRGFEFIRAGRFLQEDPERYLRRVNHSLRGFPDQSEGRRIYFSKHIITVLIRHGAFDEDESTREIRLTAVGTRTLELVEEGLIKLKS